MKNRKTIVFVWVAVTWVLAVNLANTCNALTSEKGGTCISRISSEGTSDILGIPPTCDGVISSGEWCEAYAQRIELKNANGRTIDAERYFMYDEAWFYFALVVEGESEEIYLWMGQNENQAFQKGTDIKRCMRSDDYRVTDWEYRELYVFVEDEQQDVEGMGRYDDVADTTAVEFAIPFDSGDVNDYRIELEPGFTVIYGSILDGEYATTELIVFQKVIAENSARKAKMLGESATSSEVEELWEQAEEYWEEEARAWEQAEEYWRREADEWEKSASHWREKKESQEEDGNQEGADSAETCAEIADREAEKAKENAEEAKTRAEEAIKRAEEANKNAEEARKRASRVILCVITIVPLGGGAVLVIIIFRRRR
ncbi:MAG: hypothetical protein HXS41_05675 [Theionarchaea archaeon]|nr:hypothetical protein [Theionarchaea archaeon]MBU7034206.1 hypothetical protein [Theionarchaea archaeon]